MSNTAISTAERAAPPSRRASLGSSLTRRRYSGVGELIATPRNPTPLVRLNRVTAAETEAYLLEGMRERGELDGRELVEATSGNTGIALAALAALEGIPLTVTIPSEVPEEKLVLLRMLGATVMPTPDELCPVDNPRDGAIALAHAIAESPAYAGRYAMPNQYANPDNVRAHYETTGPRSGSRPRAPFARSSRATGRAARSRAWGGFSRSAIPRSGSSPWSHSADTVSPV